MTAVLDIPDGLILRTDLPDASWTNRARVVGEYFYGGETHGFSAYLMEPKQNDQAYIDMNLVTLRMIVLQLASDIPSPDLEVLYRDMLNWTPGEDR